MASQPKNSLPRWKTAKGNASQSHCAPGKMDVSVLVLTMDAAGKPEVDVAGKPGFS